MKGCPSQTTIKNSELYLASDSIIKVLHEMKNDGAEVISITTDHGHQMNQDHFFIVVAWPVRDTDGNRTVKFFCPSIDSAGHHAVEAAEAVHVIKHLFVDENIQVVAATSNSGGGS